MQCQHCGKSDWVTIGNQKYCANCGEPGAGSSPVNLNPTPATPTLPSNPPVQVTQASQPPPVPPTNSPAIGNSQPVPTPETSATTPAETSIKLSPVLNDLSRPASSTPVNSVPTSPLKPANNFHNSPAPAPSGVIDLRQINVTPAPAKEAAPSLSISTPTPPAVTPPSTPTSTPPPSLTPSQPIVPATPITQTPVNATVTPAVASPDNPQPNPSQLSSIQKFVRPANQMGPAAPAVTPPPAPVLPNQAVTHIESLNKLIPPSTVPGTNPQLTPVTSSAPKVQNLMAATLAIMVMGGYIWLNNFNTMSLKSASKKAGIQASLPAYMPNSYSMAGPVSYGQGFVTFDFKSPNSNTPLTITQRRTSWDSAALLQMYVHPKSSSYVSVANQGLTIYLYNNNQATWVNKGLQYVISGDTRLSREQVLKIAESL